MIDWLLVLYLRAIKANTRKQNKRRNHDELDDATTYIFDTLPSGLYMVGMLSNRLHNATPEYCMIVKISLKRLSLIKAQLYTCKLLYHTPLSFIVYITIETHLRLHPAQ